MTSPNKAVIWIGGAAGDGIASVADTLATACTRSDLYVFAHNSYQSVIRGGHVHMQLQVSNEKALSQGDNPDVLIALNLDTLQRHSQSVKAGGTIIYNNEKIKPKPGTIPDNVNDCGMPSSTLAAKHGRNPIMQNVVALGSLIQIMKMPLEKITTFLTETFKKKGEAVIDANIGAVKAGYEHAEKNFKKMELGLKYGTKRRMLMTGNEAIAVGAVASGCKFYAAYPMSPASSILHWFANNGPKFGVLVKQAEDEIAAMNMTVGAGHVGVRAMAGTSGGGFALMTEAIGLAAMTETPAVVVNVQRGGPSTGLPTKTEQADLYQMLGASQGDFPKFILAPCNIEDAFYTSAEAHNLAEKYQTVVMIASDLLLSEHSETIDPLDFSKIKIDRGELIGTGSKNGNGSTEKYLRFKDTPSGISPRALPGTPDTIHVTASDEHNEEGVVISDVFSNPKIRKQMMEKRMRKMDTALKELPPPQLYGPADAPLTFVTWGSSWYIVRDVMRQLEREGIKTNHLNIKYIWPFQAKEVTKILKSVKKTLMIECSYTGQMEKLIRQETGISMDHSFHKYDGEPFGPKMVLEKAKELL